MATVYISGKLPAKWNGRLERCRACLAWIGWGKRKDGLIPFDYDIKSYPPHWKHCSMPKLYRPYEEKYKALDI